MKKNNFYLAFLVLFTLVSCSSDDNEEQLVDDGTVGVERFLISTSTQALAEIKNEPVMGELSKDNYISIQGYVMPNYYASTKVFLTIENLSSDDISFKYGGKEVNAGEEFQIVEFFSEGSFSSIKYNPASGNKAEFDLVFRNSLGSVFKIPYSATLTE